MFHPHINLHNILCICQSNTESVLCVVQCADGKSNVGNLSLWHSKPLTYPKTHTLLQAKNYVIDFSWCCFPLSVVAIVIFCSLIAFLSSWWLLVVYLIHFDIKNKYQNVEAPMCYWLWQLLVEASKKDTASTTVYSCRKVSPPLDKISETK